jgi:transglutaminase-like putative cysteine protease
MRKTLAVFLILGSLISIFLLSAFSNILTAYQIPTTPAETPQNPTDADAAEKSLVALFKVTPVIPTLYWRIWTADYYTGLSWFRSTNETVLEELPIVHNANSTKIFTVEINTTDSEFFLPLPSSQSTFESTSLTPSAVLKPRIDAMAQTYKLKRYGQTQQTLLTYNVSWNDVEVEDELISLGNVSQQILDKYLQLPNLPLDVRKLAQDLEDPSYSILDQILADVQFLRTNFTYDRTSSPNRIYGEITQGSDISSYIKLKTGVCIDAATALTIILRIQKIPARISVGFKPGGIEEGKLAYYSEGAHALTEAFLPPFGWVQFDATPPLEDVPLVRVLPFKKEAAPGTQLFYQVSITNRLNSTEEFRLLSDQEQEWDVEAAPEELHIEAGQTADAVLEAIVPDSASFGEKNILQLTVTSYGQRYVAFSILAIAQVQNTTAISTNTAIKSMDEIVIRKGSFWVNGTVLDVSDEGVDNMTVFVFLTKGRKTEGVIAGRGYSKQGKFQINCTTPYFLEIGDYSVISLSLGTQEYAPSNGDSTIKIAAWTTMKLGPEEEFLLGYGAIHGSLSWDNGTVLPNAPVAIKITSFTNLSEVTILDKLTSQDGIFRIATTTFEDAGRYEVEAVFLGNEYILGSNVTSTVNLKRGQLEISISAEKTAIRGDVWTISGKIQSEGVGIWGEPLTLALDQQSLAAIETRENGTFSYSFLINLEQELGAHFMIVSLSRGDKTAIHEVAIKSKTNLTTEISNVAGGMFLLFSASLSDDHQRPIQGAEITVDNFGMSLKTDDNGNSTVLLNNLKLLPENPTLTVRFDGSEFYLPIMAEKETNSEHWISLILIIPLVAPGLVALAITYGKRLSEKRRALQRNNRKITQETTITEPKTLMPEEPQTLRIVLLDIPTQFPPVWGINEELRIEIALDEDFFEENQNTNVEVSIDAEKRFSVVLSQRRRAELSLVFIQKGEHKIRANLSGASEHQTLNAEIKLRVVDYEEEILRLYDEFLRKLPAYGIDVRKEMTAHEIEQLILNTIDFDSNLLRRVTTCFENAEYSDHGATRKDYEIIYLNLKELGIGIE